MFYGDLLGKNNLDDVDVETFGRQLTSQTDVKKNSSCMRVVLHQLDLKIPHRMLRLVSTVAVQT